MDAANENATLLLVIAAVVVFLIGLSKGGLGGGAGALATSMLALVLPADKVVGLLLPILMFADIFAVAFHWRRWNRRLVLLLLPGAVVGVTVGTLFLANAPTETLRTLLGILVLIFAAYKIFEQRTLRWINYKSRNWHGLLAGTASGFSSALAHSGGPPVRIYLLMQDVKPAVFVASSALFFSIVNWIKVPYYFYAQLLDFERLRQFVWLLPLVPLGVWFGRWAVYRVRPQAFERVIVGLLAINGILLIAL